ncbi:hypothetical protein QTL86_14445 [Cellulosilyticum sp. ST5]|uniref:hypothetical protein n=1 Tax=unclassified Cellulosilyticum TaxID=2643091 RepID=UPI0016808C98|nr:hypothetical protein [Cellulosilyticum sp. WCF-2]
MQENEKVTKELTDEELMELAGGFIAETSLNKVAVLMYAIRPIFPEFIKRVLGLF